MELTRQVIAAKKRSSRSGEIQCDETLFEELRALRKNLADDRSVPAYVIFSGATLRYIARMSPADRAAFGIVPGVDDVY